MQVNFNIGQRTIQQSFALLLVCFVFAVRVLSGQTFVSSAIEHAEIYSSTCLAADPHCYLNEHAQVQLEDEPSSTLNLSFHLLSSPAFTLTGILEFAPLPHALHGHALSLLLMTFPSSIFHPPK
jgi:hypothetical protein